MLVPQMELSHGMKAILKSSEAGEKEAPIIGDNSLTRTVSRHVYDF